MGTQVVVVRDGAARPEGRVVQTLPAPPGWVTVTPFALTLLSKPTTLFSRTDGGCVPMRFQGSKLTLTRDDAFGASGLNLAAVGEGPSHGPLKLVTRFSLVIESGDTTHGPVTLRLDEIEQGYVDAKGKHVNPPGHGEGWGGDPSPLVYTLVAEDPAGLVVIDEPGPFAAYNPAIADRWFASESACTAAAPPHTSRGLR